jgi:hypothetical protein
VSGFSFSTVNTRASDNKFRRFLCIRIPFVYVFPFFDLLHELCLLQALLHSSLFAKKFVSLFTSHTDFPIVLPPYDTSVTKQVHSEILEILYSWANLCVCVCVWERERERGDRKYNLRRPTLVHQLQTKGRATANKIVPDIFVPRVRACVRARNRMSPGSKIVLRSICGVLYHTLTDILLPRFLLLFCSIHTQLHFLQNYAFFGFRNSSLP